MAAKADRCSWPAAAAAAAAFGWHTLSTASKAAPSAPDMAVIDSGQRYRSSASRLAGSSTSLRASFDPLSCVHLCRSSMNSRECAASTTGSYSGTDRADSIARHGTGDGTGLPRRNSTPSRTYASRSGLSTVGSVGPRL